MTINQMATKLTGMSDQKRKRLVAVRVGQKTHWRDPDDTSNPDAVRPSGAGVRYVEKHLNTPAKIDDFLKRAGITL